MQNTNKIPNALIHESSPYLLQHAYNPVQWYPWGQNALQMAIEQNKPILVSIGYAACHWCHVMEHQSFENEIIARKMNEHFICIKIDREERPDVDAVYMDAVQAMGLNGGWPLNVFLLPDQRPFYGGTYFPPQNWLQLLDNVNNAFKNHRKELEDSATGFTTHISHSEVLKYGLQADESINTLEEMEKMYQTIEKDFDTQKGGINKAPKFPMPSIATFLCRYVDATQNPNALKHLWLTLKKMAFGGIYDQIGGGFSRYSVDSHWFCPHFEKMLYDNAQLIGLYAEAYSLFKKLQPEQTEKHEILKNIVYESIAFVKNELTSPENGFFSALDADSEGVEGKFYVWKYDEIQEVIQEIAQTQNTTNPTELELFCNYYNATPQGNWEHENNIFHKTLTDEAFAEKYKISLETLQEKVKKWKALFLKTRTTRIKPSLDNKILAGWNALNLKALANAYKIFAEPDFLDAALKNADFLYEKMLQEDLQGKKVLLFRNYKNGKASISAYLEDYACLIDAFRAVYEITFDEKWLKYAKDLLEYVLEHFYDEKEEMFFFTNKNAESLIARKKEIFDNVIPSSNAIMAHNLYFMGILFDEPRYTDISKLMLSKMKAVLMKNIQYVCHWACLFAYTTTPTAEVVLVGSEVHRFRRELEQYYFPNKIIVGTLEESSEKSVFLPLLKNRNALQNETTVFVCYNKTCKLPVKSIEKTLNLLINNS